MSTNVTAPTAGSIMPAGGAAVDNFAFNAHLGDSTVSGFQPPAHQVDLDHTLFAGVADLIALAADHIGGSARGRDCR